MMEAISRDRAMKLVKRWYAAPRMKRNTEVVSARHVPRGQYIFNDTDGSIGALDNSQGRCLVESFDSLVAATEWLTEEKE